MMWYCAHAIFYYRYDGQDSYPVHENVYLISAPAEEQAMRAAAAIAAEYEQLGGDSQLEIDGRKAEYVFAGVRKLISIESGVEDFGVDAASGVEVTYSAFDVESLADVLSLASGDPVAVVYRE
ncbi:DUF4288 domain-containing protein [Stenotrophomonas sp. 24(2023)]|uniref:DUF4288 domain-containing protein n=1 Tax=Stenotrophomonas sp. 24(2023) TaxID=3068324 RepID=UPI0027DF6A18|nr:DUF4288 domain-containing protein [Stenotrophomonas sp. 24(2023)]WMJ70563.1 DUF4288 domain-containing protein [Stenotrophomonas sp. 24(2023)]